MNHFYNAAAYWIVATCASLAMGWYALPIFSVTKTTEPMLWQQRFLNFVGALIGWAALWFLGLRYWPCLTFDGCPSSATVNSWSLLGGFIAFIGVTGYLPQAVIGAIHAILGVSQKLAELLAMRLEK